MGAAEGAGEFGLGFRTDTADHRGTKMIGPLAEDQADSSRRRTDKDRFSGLHEMGSANQVHCRHPLEHHRRGRPVLNAVRNRNQQ